MAVSKNRGGPPKSSMLIGFSMKKPSILGYHYFWKHPYIDISGSSATNFQKRWTIYVFLIITPFRKSVTFLVDFKSKNLTHGFNNRHDISSSCVSSKNSLFSASVSPSSPLLQFFNWSARADGAPFSLANNSVVPLGAAPKKDIGWCVHTSWLVHFIRQCHPLGIHSQL